jgi:hypothetical protein
MKVLRSIRQRMINDGRITRYLTYAIGEIILVVISIFLALQLNNWNSVRKEHSKELALLAEMRNDLDADLADCRYNIAMNQRLLKGNVAVLSHLEERMPFPRFVARTLREHLRIHGPDAQHLGLRQPEEHRLRLGQERQPAT